MGSINDYGDPTNPLSAPALGGPDGWAAAVAAALDNDDTPVSARFASPAYVDAKRMGGVMTGHQATSAGGVVSWNYSAGPTLWGGVSSGSPEWLMVPETGMYQMTAQFSTAVSIAFVVHNGSTWGQFWYGTPSAPLHMGCRTIQAGMPIGVQIQTGSVGSDGYSSHFSLIRVD